MPDEDTSQEGKEDQNLKTNDQTEQETEETKMTVENSVLNEDAVPGAAGATQAEPLAQKSPEERPGEETGVPDPVTPELSSQTRFSGELQLCIEKSVDLQTSIELFTYLQTIAELKIIRTSGSLDNDVTMTLTIDNPIPLIDLIKMRLKGIEVISEPPEKDDYTGIGTKTGGARLTLIAK